MRVVVAVTKLHDLFDRFAQSPWLDNLTRRHATGGQLRDLVTCGVRGVTSNPTLFERAIARSDDYDDQLRAPLSPRAAPGGPA